MSQATASLGQNLARFLFETFQQERVKDSAIELQKMMPHRSLPQPTSARHPSLVPHQIVFSYPTPPSELELQNAKRRIVDLQKQLDALQLKPMTPQVRASPPLPLNPPSLNPAPAKTKANKADPQLARFREQLERLVNENKQLRDQLGQVQEANRNFVENCTQTEKELNASKLKTQELQTNLGELKKEFAIVIEDANDLVGENQQLQETNNKLRSEIDLQKNECNRVLQQQQTFDQKMKDLLAKIQTSNVGVGNNAQPAEVERLKSRLLQLQSECATLKGCQSATNELEQYKRQAQLELSKQSALFQNERTRLEQEMAESKRENELLIKTIHENNATYAAQLNALRQKQRTLLQSVATQSQTQIQTKTQNTTLENMESKLLQLQQTQQKLSKERDDLILKNQQLGNELRRRDDIENKHASVVRGLQAEIQKGQAQYDSLNREVVRIRSEENEIQQRADTTDEELEKLLGSYQALSKKLTASQTENSTLRGQTETLAAALAKQNEESQVEIKELERANNRLSQRLAACQSKSESETNSMEN